MNTMLPFLLTWVVSGADANHEVVSPRVVYSQQHSFRIPLDLTDDERSRISAIRYFLSRDQGVTWEHQSDGGPEAIFHTFHADRDGEYWFSIALVELNGMQVPPNIEAVPPGLKVVVDSKSPALVLKPLKNRAGRAGVRWECEDQDIDARTMRLAVWENETMGWQPFPVPDPTQPVVWFDEHQRVEKIQALVMDRAGNAGILQVDLFGDRYAKRIPTSFALPDLPGTHDIRIPNEVWATNAPSSEFGGMGGSNGLEHVAASVPRNVNRAESIDPPSDLMASAPPKNELLVPPTPLESQADVAPPAMPPAVLEQPSSNDLPGDASFCNSRRVVINYEVEQSAMKESTVELWATSDRGATWLKVADDPDQSSPIEADLDQDGLWGLAVVISTTLSGPARTPGAGTPPDAYVYIDTQSPRVDVSAPEVRNGQVILRWQATDPHLSEQTVRIAYATSPDGPWTGIVERFENTGEYVWNFVRSQASGTFYFRVDVEDEAGNVGSAMTAEPVPVTVVPPKARVTKVIGKSEPPMLTPQSTNSRLSN